MKIAILEPGAPPKDLIGRFGSYGDMVAAMLGDGIEATKFDVRRGAYPPPAGFDGYVITGSAAGVYDPDPWIPDLKGWMQRTAGTAPMLGICFGHQLMAEAFGGRAEKSDRGWGVGLDSYGLNATAPWMERGAATMTLPVSHQDQVTAVGPGAAVLGGSDFCPFGLIAYPDLKAVSLQPHPEFDPRYAEALITSRRDGPLTPEHADRAIASLKAPNDNARVGGWLGRFLREA